MRDSTERYQSYLTLLREEIVPAFGCTEPAAVAFCTASAAKQLPSSTIKRVEIKASAYIIRNGMHVGIPGAQSHTGLPLAAALGSLLQYPENAMEIFSGVTPEQVQKARRMVREGRISVESVPTSHKIWIEASVTAENGDQGIAVIQGAHTHLVRIAVNGQTLFSSPYLTSEVSNLPCLTLNGIYEFCMGVDVKSLDFLEDVIHLNIAIAKEGLTHDYGLQVGKRLLKGALPNARHESVVALTAAAADARMAGCDFPVMTNMGSGNQGITASIPVIETAKQLGVPRDMMLRALALSELVAMDVKIHLGRLSALCGCSISAAIGAACGITFLKGGGYEQLAYAVKTMVADVAGTVCDGAKPGCALKIATAVSAAQRAAALAIFGSLENGHFGIVSEDVEVTLQNLALLGQRGMSGTNETVLDIMLQEQSRATVGF